MECDICAQPYDLREHMPLVLGCGHTFCLQCLERSFPQGPVTCFVDRQEDSRCVSMLPRNMAHIDAHKLDLQQLMKQFSGISIGAGLFVDERELRLSSRVLGTGATGQVVEGTFRNKPVAVKVVDLSDAPPEVCQALQREAGVVLAVSGECRHTCQYKGATIKGNRFCLIMKRYSKSLARLIADAGPGGLPIAQLLRYGGQILSALVELHSQGVVMADLKPQNLLLDDDLDELVVTDFGLSRIVSHTVGGYRPSQTAAGTPNYMCPEQYAIDEFGNPAVVTPAVDVWAWACCMIHMATSRVPFGNLNPQQICMQVGMHKRAPPVPSSLPEALQRLMKQCMAELPERRPSAKQALQTFRSPAIQQAAAAAVPQNLEALFVCTSPSPVTKRLVVRFEPQQQLRQLKQQLIEQALPAVLQGVLSSADAQELPACCFPDPFTQTFVYSQHGELTLQQLGVTPATGKLLIVGMDAESLAALGLQAGKVSKPEIPAMHQHARSNQKLQLLLLLELFACDINECIPASGCSVLDAALQSRHLDLAEKLLQLHGSRMQMRVLLNSLPSVFRQQAWGLAGTITKLIEQRTGTKQQAGSTTFYVTEPETFQEVPHLLQRLKEAGTTPVVLAKVWHQPQHLKLAVELDPHYLTRNLKAQQCVHMFNVYTDDAGGSLTYLHHACGFQSTAWEGAPPADLDVVRLAVSLADNVDAQQRHIFKADSHDVKDYERSCCRSCLSEHLEPTACVCLKFSSLHYTPLHMSVLHGCQYRWTRGLLSACLPWTGCDRTKPAIDYDRMVQAATAWLPVARILVEAGADVNRPDARGRSPLQLLQTAVKAAEELAAEELAADELAADEAGVDDVCKTLLLVLRSWERLFQGQRQSSTE